jgi:hypothetical protein
MTEIEELRALIETTHADLVTLRDNHVHHLGEDISTLKTDVAVIKEKVSGLESFKDEIITLFRPYLQAALLLGLSTIGLVGSQM